MSIFSLHDWQRWVYTVVFSLNKSAKNCIFFFLSFSFFVFFVFAVIFKPKVVHLLTACDSHSCPASHYCNSQRLPIVSMHANGKSCPSPHCMLLAKVVRLLTMWYCRKLNICFALSCKANIVHLLNARDWQRLSISSQYVVAKSCIFFALSCKTKRCPFSHCTGLAKVKRSEKPSFSLRLIGKGCPFSHCIYLAKNFHLLTACGWQECVVAWARARIP